MDILELLIIFISVFASWYVLTRTSSLPRQLWRAPVAGFGCSLLCVGVIGTANSLRLGIDIDATLSRKAQEAAFELALAACYQPLSVASVALAIFVMVVWSSARGDSEEDLPNYGDYAARIMVLGTAISLAGLAIVGVRTVMGYDVDANESWLVGTMLVAAATVLFSVVGGLRAGVQVDRMIAARLARQA